MEKSDLIKLSVLIVVGLIVFSGFAVFGGSQTASSAQNQDTANSNYSAPIIFREVGSANLTGAVKKYGSELSIKPWKEEYTSILTDLREQGQIDYANAYGETAVLILSENSNITFVREAFLGKDVEAAAEAVIGFNKLFNFTINGNETREVFIPDANLVLDPLAGKGTEIDFGMTADLEGSRIITVQSHISPRATEITINGSVLCQDIYRVETLVSWENRFLNLTQLSTSLNTSENTIEYERNDAVFFGRKLNETEAQAIIAANSSFVTASGIEGMMVNTTDKDMVESFLEQFNVSVSEYPETPLIVLVKGEDSSNIAKIELGHLGKGIASSIGCTITLDKEVSVNRQSYLVEETARSVDYFLLADNIANRINMVGNAEYIGRIITNFDLQTIVGTFNETVNANEVVGENMTNENVNIGERKTVKIVTNKGTFKAEIYGDKAPITATNFLKLVTQGFYNNLTFHRYVPGFVIQGGDPKGDGSGGSNETIKLEIIPELKHIAGAVAMARSPNPDSASSQFYVALEDLPALDGNYAVFGQVIEGMDVVLQLRAGDKMTSVTIE